jgi:HEAT repeat protein
LQETIMNSVHTMLMALLTVSGATSAQTAIESSRSADDEYRLLVAQADVQAGQTDAEGASEKRESRGKLSEQEALALAAMEGLMAQPTERALPIIKKVLAGSQTTLVKKRALFVLSQIDSPEAEQILIQTSRSPDRALRSEAIRSIGIGGNPKSLAALQEIYNAGDGDVKDEVLEAWMIAGRKEEVYQAAINAKSEAEASEAIRMLGVMGAVDELRKLGARPNPPRGLVEAYAIGGDLASLRKIAEGSGDLRVRAEAVQKIGIIGDADARVALRDIYTRSADDKIKDAALQGLLIAGDDQGVLALYRAAKTTEEKQELLRTLTMMDSDAALEAIDAALEGRK